MSRFSVVFKNLRIGNGYTQQELANKIGVSRSAVGMYENGDREPDFETLEVIADFFNVDMDYLMGRSDKTHIVTVRSENEQYFIQQFRLLNYVGQDKAISCVDDLVASGKYDPIRELDTDIPRNAVAAHDRTDIEATDDMRKFDDEIMEDMRMREHSICYILQHFSN